MSTPNPILKAAAPTLIQALQLVNTAANTILTGDPLLMPGRATAAFTILLGQLELLLPGLEVAEVGVVQTDINSKIAALITKLTALNAPPSPAA